MANPAFVQVVSNGSNAVTLTVTAGNGLIINTCYDSALTITSVTVSGNSNATSVRDDTDATNSETASTHQLSNITSGGSVTVTANGIASSGSGGIIVTEVSGQDTTNMIDNSGNAHAGQVQNAPGTGTDAVTSTNLTTATNNALIHAVTWNDSAGQTAVASAGTGYTRRLNNVTLQFAKTSTEDKTLATAGAVAGTFTYSANESCITQAVGIKPGATGNAASSDGSGLATATGASSAAVPASSDGVALATAVGAAADSADASSDGVGLATAVGAAAADVVATSDGVGLASGEGISTATAVMTSDGVGVAQAVGQASSTGAADASSDGVATADATATSTAAADASSDGLGDAQAVGIDSSQQAPAITVVPAIDVGSGGTNPRPSSWQRRAERRRRELEMDDEEIAQMAKTAIAQISRDYIARLQAVIR